MSELNLKDYICNIPDFPKPGIIFRDVTTLIQAPEAYAEACRRMTEMARELKPDVIAVPEARGFLFGCPIALALNCSLVPIRKPHKLPRKVLTQEYALEYGTDTLNMHEDAIQPGARVLIIDDLLATGGTAQACRLLIEQTGAQVVGYGFLVELSEECNGREFLSKEDNMPVFSVIEY